MEEKIIKGSEIAKQIKLDIKHEVEKLEIKPCLAVVIVGDNEASKIYVKNKEKACQSCGIESIAVRLNTDITEEELENEIQKLNNDKNVHGILVQLPLPKHLDENKIINLINPDKDVDCFHPINIGKMFAGFEKNMVLPCTPKGCMILIKTVCKDLTGKKAVVIGRSNIVGKPVAQLLLRENCTVTMVHSKTKNIEEETKTADIVVVAVGKSKFLKANMIKDNAVIIDVGINRLDDGAICGDVDFDDVINKCGYITPVPKGVGPMTIACLLQNLMVLYYKQLNK